MAEGRVDLVISDLAVTEGASALARRVREGTLTSAGASRVLRAIVEALDGGVYRRVDLTADVYRRAEHFLLSLGATPLRALDALHLALAMSARAASMASFDVRLAAAARAVGLATYPA
jgi:predicted nucleic acid-binding protein